MRKIVTALLLYLIGCVGCSAGQWRHVDRATLALSTVSLLTDGAQTMSAANDGWSGGRREINPVLGSTPSSGAVGVYFATAIAVNAIVWAVTPARWRSAAPTALTIVEAGWVTLNLRNTNVMGVGSDRWR